MATGLLCGVNAGELLEYFGLPKHTKSFTLHVDCESIATIEAVFYPEKPDFGQEPVKQRFHLLLIDDEAANGSDSPT